MSHYRDSSGNRHYQCRAGQVSNVEGSRRYVARRRGEMPGVPLVSVDEAVRVLR
jgi:hypothetical protein